MIGLIPTTTWSRHNCSKSHRSSATFIECCLNKYYHNGENSHRPSIRVHGEGEWAVIKESWSNVYYTEHSGRRNNQTHKVFEVALLSTYETACSFYEEVSSTCWDDNCRGGRCVELREQIVKISK